MSWTPGTYLTYGFLWIAGAVLAGLVVLAVAAVLDMIDAGLWVAYGVGVILLVVGVTHVLVGVIGLGVRAGRE